jgi:hypothetical protein
MRAIGRIKSVFLGGFCGLELRSMHYEDVHAGPD